MRVFGGELENCFLGGKRCQEEQTDRPPKRKEKRRNHNDRGTNNTTNTTKPKQNSNGSVRCFCFYPWLFLLLHTLLVPLYSLVFVILVCLVLLFEFFLSVMFFVLSIYPLKPFCLSFWVASKFSIFCFIIFFPPLFLPSLSPWFFHFLLFLFFVIIFFVLFCS